MVNCCGKIKFCLSDFEKSVFILYKSELRTHTCTCALILCPGTVWVCILNQQLPPCSHAVISRDTIDRCCSLDKVFNLHRNNRARLSDYCWSFASPPPPFSLCVGVCGCVGVCVRVCMRLFLSPICPLRWNSWLHFRISHFLSAPRPSQTQTQACEPAHDAAQQAGGSWRSK